MYAESGMCPWGNCRWGYGVKRCGSDSRVLVVGAKQQICLSINGDYIIMPNHLPGILWVGRVGPDLRVRPAVKEDQNDAPIAVRPSLSDIMQWFKTMSTNAYFKGVKEQNWPPVHKRLWQRNYYEHV